MDDFGEQNKNYVKQNKKIQYHFITASIKNLHEFNMLAGEPHLSVWADVWRRRGSWREQAECFKMGVVTVKENITSSQ